jgi:hypothetical protein
MKEVTTTKERVIKASETCPDAKGVLKELFPEVFKEEWRDITSEIQVEWEPTYTERKWYFFKLYHGSGRSEDAAVGIVYPKSGTEDVGLKIQASNFKLEYECDALRILKKW